VGSWILEEPIHFFDLARWYFEWQRRTGVDSARANSRDLSRPDLHDHFTATIGFADGAYAVIVPVTIRRLVIIKTVKVSEPRDDLGPVERGDARAPRPVFSLRYWIGVRLRK